MRCNLNHFSGNIFIFSTLFYLHEIHSERGENSSFRLGMKEWRTFFHRHINGVRDDIIFLVFVFTQIPTQVNMIIF